MLTGVALLATTSCSDPKDEVTTLTIDRLLRPSELELKIYDKTNIKATMEFVSLPDFIDVVLEVNDNPLSEDKNYKEVKRYTLNPKESTTSRDHVTVSTNITDLSYFKDYRVSFIARNGDGKTSTASTAVATTDGIFKANDDDDRTNTSITVKWPSDVTVNKVRTMRYNEAGDEELVGEDTLDDTAKTSGKFTKTGLNADTEYVFYIFNDDNCQGRTEFETFPNYEEFKAQDGFDLQAAIDNVQAGYAIMLSPDGDNTEFNLASSTVNITKTVRIMGRDTKPVTVNKVSFNLDGSTGLSLENLKFADSEKKLALLKFTNPASGDYKLSGVEVTGYKNFAQDPGENATDLNLLEVKNCFMHDGISGRWMDFQKKKCYIKDIVIEQNTFAQIANAQDFLRYDYYEGHMPTVTIENNSFYKVNASSKGIAYIRSNAAGDKAFTCNINKNIFESCKDASGVYFSEDAKTDGLSFSKNYYKDSDNLQNPYSPTMTAFDSNGSTFTGKSAFKDPEAGDFTITNNTVKNAGVGNTDFVKK